jgi:hypothetical protein
MPAVDNSMHVFNPAALRQVQHAQPQPRQPDDAPSFGDLLDIVNPLQHLPVVGTLYRKLTGDQISTPAKIAGDAIYGGPVGLLSSLGDTAFEAVTGKSVGDTVMGFVLGDDAGKTGVAAAQPIATPPATIMPSTANAAPTALATAPAPTSVPQWTDPSPASSAEATTAALNLAQLANARRAAAAYARPATPASTSVAALSY